MNATWPNQGQHKMKFRRWQILARECVKGLRAKGIDRALIAASPGTGKTLFTASLLSDELADGHIKYAVVVVPSRAIKRGWSRALKTYGLKSVADIDNGTLEDRQARGMDPFDPARPIHIVTYQQVCRFPDLYAAMCARDKVYVVFDEIHHVDDEAQFGEAVIKGFDRAVFKLSLSGTPCPTRGNRMAFCEAEKQVTPDGKYVMVTKADFTYSYGEALQATGLDDDPYVVRPVTFMRWNGEARWRYQSLTDPTGPITERRFTGNRKSDPLIPLLDPDLPSLKKMLGAALTELESVRKEHANAGMLITVADAEHGDAVAELVRSLGVRDLVNVRYDMPTAQDMIRDFEEGRQRVLIAIKMVAEGVDITRLRVGVYASNILTWMYFMQFVGRFIRWDKGLPAGQFATVFIPEHVILMDYARRIEKMVLDATIHEEGPGGPGPGPATQTVVSKDADGFLNGAIQHGIDIAKAEEEELQDWARRAGVEGIFDRARLAALMRAYREKFGGETAAPPPFEERSPEVIESEHNDKLVGRIVLFAKKQARADLTYQTINVMANRHVGIQKKDKLTPLGVLVARRKYLQTLLAAMLERERDVPN